MSRYNQLLAIVKQVKPKIVMEMGTHNGSRALQMETMHAGFRYIGFDLFEDGTDELDKQEFNVKPRATLAAVSKRLKGAGIDAELIKGNTRETIIAWAQDNPGVQIDVAFIDGGHSLATIENDFAGALSVMRMGGGVIVLDDYYTSIPSGRLDEVGCNKLVHRIPDAEVLPIKNHLAGGGFVQMVRVNT